MRIGIDVSILAPRTHDSGIGRYVRRLVEHLPTLYPECLLVLFAPPDCPEPPALPANVAWQALPRPPLGKLSMLAVYSWSLPHLARRWRLDVFHAPTVHPRPSWPPLPRRMPCPLVVTIHDLIPLTFYASGPARLPRTHLAFYRWNLRAAARAEQIITVSDSERQTITRTLGIDDDRISAIYNGVDAPAPCLERRNTPLPVVPMVLFVGSYEARKNLPSLVRAFGRASRRGLPHQLVVVATSGSGPAAPIQEALRRFDLAGRVRFVEGRQITDAALGDLYARAELFVYPSLADSFGLPPLEAMAAGVPVIASGLPALREVLGDAAVYVDGGDEQKLAEAILRLADDSGERMRRSAAGAAWARRYSWEECARQTLDVYRRASGTVRARAAEPAREPAMR